VGSAVANAPRRLHGGLLRSPTVAIATAAPEGSGAPPLQLRRRLLCGGGSGAPPSQLRRRRLHRRNCDVGWGLATVAIATAGLPRGLLTRPAVGRRTCGGGAAAREPRRRICDGGASTVGGSDHRRRICDGDASTSGGSTSTTPNPSIVDRP
jgi:hypothetical protein